MPAMLASMRRPRCGRLPLAVAVLLVMGPWGLVAAPAAQKLVVLVRHAERADGGVPASGMMGPADPDLSAEGKARAERLAAVLADAGITRIVVTEFRRTAQTAEPLAQRLGLSLERARAADMPGLAERLRGYTNDIVLVVGHSNSTPALITALGGPSVTIPDTDYSSLFIFVPATRTLTRLRF